MSSSLTKWGTRASDRPRMSDARSLVSASRWQEHSGRGTNRSGATRSQWLVSPAFDVLFVCGLAPWIFGIVFFLVTGAGGSYLPTKFPQQTLTTLFIACSLLIGESHQFTSIIRYYKSFRTANQAFTKSQIPFWFMHALVAEALFFIFAPPALHPLISWINPVQFFLLEAAVILFPVVLLQHVCAQAIALVLRYCAVAGYQLQNSDKFCIRLTSWLLVATGSLSIAVPFSADGARDSNPFASTVSDMPPAAELTGPLVVFTTVSVLFLLFRLCHRGLKYNEWPPLGASLLWMNLVLFILLAVPLPGMAYVWLSVPLLFHATQHWAFAWHTHKTECGDELSSSAVREFGKYFLPVMTMTAVVLFLPMLLSGLPESWDIRAVFPGETLSVFFSMFVFYMHYFADRLVWRAKAEERK